LTFWGALFCCFVALFPSSFEFFFPTDTHHVLDRRTLIEIQDDPLIENADRERVLGAIIAQEAVPVMMIWESMPNSYLSIPAFSLQNPVLRC
jgi:hypothetical protein